MVTEDGSSSSTGLWSAISSHGPTKASPHSLTFGLLQELGQSRGEHTKQPVSLAALTWSWEVPLPMAGGREPEDL